MAFKPEEREYRVMPVMVERAEVADRLIDSDYYVEGYATTFSDPYFLFADDDKEVYEQIKREAFDDVDMGDVIFLHNHEGRCLARTKMRDGVSPTLILDPREEGLFCAADLSMTAEGRDEWGAITGGLVYQMSWAFGGADSEITKIGERKYLRTIYRIKKVFDVSSVDKPWNPNTIIDSFARSSVEGFIDQERQELLRAIEHERKRNQIKIMLDL